MASENQDERNVERLLEAFEEGRLSRRNLIKALLIAGGVTASTTASGDNIRYAQGYSRMPGTRMLDPSKPNLTNPPYALNLANDKGRKVLLERIMNHTFSLDSTGRVRLHGHGARGTIHSAGGTAGTQVRVVSTADHGLQQGDRVHIAGLVGSPVNNMTWEIDVIAADTFDLVDSSSNGTAYSGGTWEQVNHIFENAQHHQEWLFGVGDNHAGRGLKQYRAGIVGNNRHALTDDLSVSAGPRRNTHIGRDISTSGGPSDLEDTRENADSAKLSVFQQGANTDLNANYYFDDLYGLVRKKLQDTCDHCSTDSIIALLFFLLGENVQPGTTTKVPLTISNLGDIQLLDGGGGPVPMPIAASATVDVSIKSVMEALFDSMGDADWAYLAQYLNTFYSEPMSPNWDEIKESFHTRTPPGGPISDHSGY